jgi:hypothetical protein
MNEKKQTIFINLMILQTRGRADKEARDGVLMT